MKKIYYLTQYFDVESDKALGGILIRKKQIELFKQKGYDIIIVMPNKRIKSVFVKANIVYIPYFSQKQICDIFERLNIWPDKDYDFSIKAFNYLKNEIKSEDLVFCITGGSLETIALGNMLKNKVNCKFLINYQDPVNHTSVNGRYVDKSIRFKRDYLEKKYLENVDLIFTSSEVNRLNLLSKYKFLNEDKVINNYFGYIKKVDITSNTLLNKSLTINVMYSGIYGKHQSPELIARAFENIRNFELFFVGNYANYKPLSKYFNQYTFVEFMPHSEFLSWVSSKIDIGVVILRNEYLAACVPSKIYEYINLNIPIIGYLPDGDAKDIINNYGFGRIFHYNDENGLVDFLEKDLTPIFIQRCKKNILLQRDNWSMDFRFDQIINKITTL